MHQTWTLEFIILLLAIPNSTLCKLFHWPWKLLKKVEVGVHTQVAPSLLWGTLTIISRTYCMLKAVLFFFKMQINFEREPRRHFLTLLGYDPMELSKKVQLFLLTWDIHERNLNWKYNQKTKVFLLNYIEGTGIYRNVGQVTNLKKKRANLAFQVLSLLSLTLIFVTDSCLGEKAFWWKLSINYFSLLLSGCIILHFIKLKQNWRWSWCWRVGSKNATSFCRGRCQYILFFAKCCFGKLLCSGVINCLL